MRWTIVPALKEQELCTRNLLHKVGGEKDHPTANGTKGFVD